MILSILLPLLSFVAEQENLCESYAKHYSACLQEIYQARLVPPSALKFEINHFKNFCNNKTNETLTCFRFKEASCSVLFLCVKKLYVVHTKKE